MHSGPTSTAAWFSPASRPHFGIPGRATIGVRGVRLPADARAVRGSLPRRHRTQEARGGTAGQLGQVTPSVRLVPPRDQRDGYGRERAGDQSGGQESAGCAGRGRWWASASASRSGGSSGRTVRRCRPRSLPAFAPSTNRHPSRTWRRASRGQARMCSGSARARRRSRSTGTGRHHLRRHLAAEAGRRRARGGPPRGRRRQRAARGRHGGPARRARHRRRRWRDYHVEQRVRAPLGPGPAAHEQRGGLSQSTRRAGPTAAATCCRRNGRRRAPFRAARWWSASCWRSSASLAEGRSS